VVGGAVTARVEGEEAEPVFAEAVVDEPEVVPPEQASAELENERSIFRPGQLVVETDPRVDLGVRHRLLL
jgi:hypothetical protein